MFKKVKAKFIAISTIITAILLIFISGGIYFSIRSQTNRNNAQILDMIVTHSSNFKFWNGTWDQGWEGGDPYGGQFSNTESEPQPSEGSSEQTSQNMDQPGPDDGRKERRELPQIGRAHV